MRLPGGPDGSRTIYDNHIFRSKVNYQFTSELSLRVILDYLLEAFTPGLIYTEKEVNTIIRRFHPDTAGLRRDMINRGLLQRKSDGSQYWRPE